MKFALAALAGISSATVMNKMDYEFMKFVTNFAKFYETVEEFEARKEVFALTASNIEELNSRNTFMTAGHNQFSDWSDAEYTNFLSYRPKNTYRTQEPTILDTSDLPDSINWIEKGAVNDVQDQGQCGSCWAFSAIAQMEGQHFVQSGKLLKLSEQQCVDCDTDSYGCSGGW